MIEILGDQFNKKPGFKLTEINFNGNEFLLIQYDGLDGTLVLSQGLSATKMVVPERYEQEAQIELYVLVPQHWSPIQLENPNLTWVLNTLSRLKKHIENGNWVASGHTITLSDLPEGKLKDAHFHNLMLMGPLEADILKTPLEYNHSSIHFKALVPIFKDEKEFKESKGFGRLLNKFQDKGVSEKLDEFRSTVVKHRFLFWI